MAHLVPGLRKRRRPPLAALDTTVESTSTASAPKKQRLRPPVHGQWRSALRTDRPSSLSPSSSSSLSAFSSNEDDADDVGNSAVFEVKDSPAKEQSPQGLGSDSDTPLVFSDAEEDDRRPPPPPPPSYAYESPIPREQPSAALAEPRRPGKSSVAVAVAAAAAAAAPVMRQRPQTASRTATRPGRPALTRVHIESPLAPNRGKPPPPATTTSRPQVSVAARRRIRAILSDSDSSSVEEAELTDDGFGVSRSKPSRSKPSRRKSSAIGVRPALPSPLPPLSLAASAEPFFSSSSSSQQLWVEKYRPGSVAEICMHKRKISQIRDWLESHLQDLGQPASHPRPRALILTGPPGCGKSTVVQALADELDLPVHTWNIPVMAERWQPDRMGFASNPADALEDEGGGGRRDDSTTSFHQDSISYAQLGSLRLAHESNLERFKQFCVRSARYRALALRSASEESPARPSLSPGSTSMDSSQPTTAPSGSGRVLIDLVDSDSDSDAEHPGERQPSFTVPLPPPASAATLARKLIVLDEYPFFGNGIPGSASWNQAKNAFNQMLLREVLPHSRFLLVFLVSEQHEGHQSSASELFTQELLQSPWVGMVNCNPVNNTEMRRCLSRILDSEGLSAPMSHVFGPGFLDQLIEESRGDLRHAIQSLQFAAVGLSRGAVAAPGSMTGAPRRRPSKPRGRSDGRGAKEAAAVVSESSSALAQVLGARDSNFSIFHGMGKILYAKPDPKTGRAALEPVSVLQACSESSAYLNAHLHQNYPAALPGNCEISELADMLEEFSVGDVLLQASGRRFGDSVTACPEIISSAVSAWAYVDLRVRAVASVTAAADSVSQPTKSTSSRSSFGAMKGAFSTRVDRISRQRSLAANQLFRTPSCMRLLSGAFDRRLGSFAGASALGLDQGVDDIDGAAAAAAATMDDMSAELAIGRSFPPPSQKLLQEILPQLAVMERFVMPRSSRNPKQPQQQPQQQSLPAPHSTLLRLLSGFSASGRPVASNEFRWDAAAAELKTLAWSDPMFRDPAVSVVSNPRRSPATASASAIAATAAKPIHVVIDLEEELLQPEEVDATFGLNSLDEALLLNIDLEHDDLFPRSQPPRPRPPQQPPPIQALEYAGEHEVETLDAHGEEEDEDEIEDE